MSDGLATDWLNQRERGTVAAIRLGAFWATRFGRRLSRPLVRAIAAYYLIFDGHARRTIGAWIKRIEGRPAKLGDVYRHLTIFVQVTLDRIYFAQGIIEPFEIERTGNQYLIDLAAQGRGAILMGAHLGSFDSMRASGRSERFPVTIVGHWQNAKMINAVLTSLDPAFPTQVIDTGTDPVSLASALRKRIEEGGMLAIMADRIGLNEKAVQADFMGSKANFASGPFLLASLLKCPVFLVFGLYEEPNRYSLSCEPFADRIELPRGERESALEEYVQRYAERLESYCRRAPNNWFNFFDFWENEER